MSDLLIDDMELYALHTTGIRLSGSSFLTWINFNPSMDKYIHIKIWGEIPYLLPNLKMDK